ncbi:MAG: peptidoglycan DL-endopeptidase CwlO [Baekduia sp.]|nr:peptidoglycan DL-endopeptidase CwlO [Baekduia sp.]
MNPGRDQVIRVAAVALVAVGVAGCGGARPAAPGAKPAGVPVASAAAGTPPLVAVAARRPIVGRDSEADAGFPLPAGVHGTREAPQPGAAPAAARTSRRVSSPADSGVSPGAPTDAQVRAELRQMNRVLRAWRRSPRRPGIRTSGRADAPAGLPEAVARIIAGGNAIATFPYVYGGGHASFVDTAYDCSASVSYALAAAGLLDRPLTSGQLARWGAPGPGRYVTIYANAGHTFMYVDGLRFDTSGRAGAFGTRWQTAPRSLAGFVVRHPAGL